MKYVKNIFIALLVVAGLAPVSLSAQIRKYAEHIEIRDFGVEPVGKSRDQAVLNFTLSFDDLSVKSNDRLLLTPFLRNKLSLEVVHAFPQVEIIGRKRTIINERLGRSAEAEVNVSLRDGVPSEVKYNHHFTYNNQMEGAELILLYQVYGCDDCFSEEIVKPVTDHFRVAFYEPQYRVSYVAPPVEPVKARADTHTATLNFRVDKSVLDPNYRNNRTILDKVQRVMEEVVHDENVRITSLTVAGYASPEAPVAYNANLAKRRAQAFSDYLSARFGLAKSQMMVTAPGEDWVLTRQLVAESDHAERGEILSIIDNTVDPDARDGKLKQLSAGATYRWMLDVLYPKVRRVEYTIAYNVRAFDVEEAREIIKTNPKLLSLNEMFLVANSYEPLSKEFKEVFDIATRLYPNEPISIINASAVDIEGGNYQKAIERLQRLQPGQLVPAALNNLGVAYVRIGDLERAKECFERASKSSDEAKHNLQEMNIVIE